MSDYTESKIYKIVCNITKEVYIGSTVSPLLKRFKQHKARCKKYDENNEGGKFSVHQIISRNDCYIELLELVVCESRTELRLREKFYIESIECINLVIPCRTRKERDSTEKGKKLKAVNDARDYKKNKEKRLEKMKQYRIKNNYNAKILLYYNSMGGNPYKNNNSLLKISMDLFDL
jgi:hypothetical protein